MAGGWMKADQIGKFHVTCRVLDGGGIDLSQSQVSGATVNPHHVIAVENCAKSPPFDAKVVGGLAGQPLRLVFSGGNSSAQWEQEIGPIAGNHELPAECALVHTGPAGQQAIQCQHFEYRKSGLQTWKPDTRNLPIQEDVTVVVP